jgi:NAD+ synthetase
MSTYRFQTSPTICLELQRRGIDLLTTASYDHVRKTPGESITDQGREIDLYSTGVAVCRQPFSTYPNGGAEPYATFAFSSDEELLQKLDEIGWTGKGPSVKVEQLLLSLREKRGFDAHRVLEQKIEAINNFFEQENLDAAVVGVSGGIDSALVLFLLKAASRREGSPIKEVMGISLPIYEAVGVTDQDAAYDKSRLIFNVGPAYYKIRDSRATSMRISHKQKAWAEGQMASVLRTPVLYYQAALLQTQGFKSIVVGTTNRDEGAYLGFFGKASDAMVDLQPIGDLHKSEVYALARLLNIPEEIIGATPAGDVWDGRNDEQMIGAPYWAVELYLLLKEYYPGYYQDIVAEHPELHEYVKAIEALHKTNAHKYKVGSPARFVDVLPRCVPGGWQ